MVRRLPLHQFRKILRRLWFTAAVLFMGWLIFSFQARGVDPQILASDELVMVTMESTTIVFTPRRQPKATGLLFYPGGMVDPRAYAPMARALAEQGFTTLIVKLPWRAAPLASHEATVRARTQALMQTDQKITQWVIGGHSRGATIAVRYVHEQPVGLAGLILIGTSHPKAAAFDLSTTELQVMKIYASHDGLASVAEVEANRHFLPADTQWVRIEGGNHAQFGYYGSQLGDQRATISRQEQQAQLVAAILNFLKEISAKA